ncbi:hypothetical protein [Aquimarina sp. RZ0]|uniref:hypothetical protein n=1 Tax=Aquimarina sp. RZ0 TaxID=2607730 RepID=UPI0011F3FBDB|nr:hypothetical protein [Aquimarina sp. RZ0]KAA1243384.1 hypothetical protein F0000_21240 [Aquimarina sp. RZ0]
MKKLKISVLLLMTSFMLSYCQNKKSYNEGMIVSFFNKVFNEENTNSKELYAKYLFEDKKANKLRDTIQNMFEKHIAGLKVKKHHLLNANSKFVVQKYKDYDKDDLITFVSDNTGGKDIHVVTVNDKIEFYVLLEKDKIRSFEYVMKSNEGLFITYY